MKTIRQILVRSFIMAVFVSTFFAPLTNLQQAGAAPATAAPEFVSKFGSPGAGDGLLNGPRDIAMDSQGNIYIVDTNNSRIQKFNNEGVFLSTFGSWGSDAGGLFRYPYAIVVDSSDNLYVAESNDRIQKFNSEGVFLSTFGTNGTGDGQMDNPGGIALDSQGNIYIADTNNSRLHKFDKDGNFLNSIGSTGTSNGQFNFPYGIAIDRFDHKYVVDAGNDRFQQFGESDEFLGKYGVEGHEDGNFYSPRGIAIDSAGYIYVVDTINDRIQKFDQAGNFLTKFGVSGAGDGEFVNPFGIFIDQLDNIYVSDSSADRIQKFAYPTQTATLTTGASSAEVLLESPGVTTITCSNAVEESALTTQDPAYTYPLGLVDFCLDVPEGSEQTVSLTFETELLPNQLVARKYNPTTKAFATISDASITETTISGKHALKVAYNLVDGGPLDDDGVVNGTILDPVGLAVANVANSGGGTADALAGTGDNARSLLVAILGISAAGLGYILWSIRSRLTKHAWVGIQT